MEQVDKRQVALASSSKFYDRLRTVLDVLSSHGVRCHTPAFDFDETKVTVDPYQKHRLTLLFLEKIRLSDAVYVINTGGYTGTSVTLEIGFAYGLGKPIYAIERPSESAVGALITDVIDVDGVIASLRKPL